MDEFATARYWCHACSQIVHPLLELDIKCPRCNGGFIEEMEAADDRHPQQHQQQQASFNTTDNLLLDFEQLDLAQVMLSALNQGLRRRRRPSSPQRSSEQEVDPNPNPNSSNEQENRRQAVIDMLSGLQDRLRSEASNESGDGDRRRRREHVILLNPFGQTLILNPSDAGVSLGDYFVGGGFEQLLQHLAENDPNRHGTPPAKKEAVEAMPVVRVDEKASCYVCLDEFEIGEEAREMPCKHRFHEGCILPWLKEHSSCPVCRFQMPVEEAAPKESNVTGNEANREEEGNGGNGGGGGGFWSMAMPWPLSALFSSAAPAQASSDGNNNHPSTDES